MRIKSYFFCLVFYWLCNSPICWGLKAIPQISSPVLDEVGVLSQSERTHLESVALIHQKEIQLQTWIFESTEGEAIESLTIRAAETWKLGGEKQDNGMIVAIALGDRKMRIEVGQGLEGDYPDVWASRAIRNLLVPSFKRGQYYDGLIRLYKSIFIHDSSSAPETQEYTRPKKKVSFLFILFLIFMIRVLTLGPSRRRGFFRSSGWRVPRGGFGGGSWSGGGGGWSGGGGGFSGGGSSGSW